MSENTAPIGMRSYKVSKKGITSIYCIYFIAALFVLIPACANPTGGIASIGFLFASTLIVIIFKDLNCLAMFYLIFLINSSLAEMPIIGTQLTITAFINLYLIIVLIIRLIKHRKEKLNYISIPLIIVWMVYLVYNYILYGFGIWAAVWYCVPFYISILMCILVSRKEKYIIHFLTCIIVAFSIVLLTGYVELFIGKTFFYSLWKTTPFYRFGILRVGSTLADPNFMCLIDVCCIFVIRTSIVQKIFGKRVITILEILAIAQVVVSTSRAGILALIACFAIEFLCKKKSWMLALIPVVIITGAALPAMMDYIFSIDISSTGSRFRVIEAALVLWRTNPVIGLGNNSFYNASYGLIGTRTDTMNVFVQQLVNFGVIGGTFYVLFFITVLKQPVKNVISKVRNAEIDAKLIAAISGWLIISFTLDTFSKTLIWLVPALEISLYYIVNNSVKSNKGNA